MVSSGEVEFRNVSFKYPDAAEYILRNVSFTASKGETVAFIGSTGSGKSTLLLNLIPRYYDATEGEVLVDGVNVKNYTQPARYAISLDMYLKKQYCSAVRLLLM